MRSAVNSIPSFAVFTACLMAPPDTSNPLTSARPSITGIFVVPVTARVAAISPLTVMSLGKYNRAMAAIGDFGISTLSFSTPASISPAIFPRTPPSAKPVSVKVVLPSMVAIFPLAETGSPLGMIASRRTKKGFIAE